MGIHFARLGGWLPRLACENNAYVVQIAIIFCWPMRALVEVIFPQKQATTTNVIKETKLSEIIQKYIRFSLRSKSSKINLAIDEDHVAQGETFIIENTLASKLWKTTGNIHVLFWFLNHVL